MKKYDVVMYVGERSDVFDRITQVFVDRKGNEIRFKGIKGIHVGGCYLCDTKAGKMNVRPDKVPNDGFEMTDELWKKYEAAKVVIKDIRLTNRKIMEVKKAHPDIVRAVNLLKPFTRNLGKYELSRFTRYLENELSKKGKMK